MTDRIYYTDSYIQNFEASIIERRDGGRRIYLDRTAFYPTSGGQPFDTGELNGVQVIDVVDEGERIAHVLATPPAGDQAVGRIDWGRRLDHMQQHTGQHLLSAVAADLLGHATVGVHFGTETSTIELDTPLLTPDQIERLEDRANQIVTENRPVEVSFEDAADAGGLRKVPARTGRLRIVSITGLDRSACGGTHVRATAEIGPILLRKSERVRQRVRLEFVCGGRAIRHARAEHQILTRLAAELSAAPEEVPDLVLSGRAELKEAAAARRDLEAQVDQYRARELYNGVPPDTAGIRRVLLRKTTGSLNELRGLAQAVTSMPRSIFVVALENPPSVLLASSADSGVNAGTVLKNLLAAAGGRGGGSVSLAQGVLPGRSQLDSVLNSLERH